MKHIVLTHWKRYVQSSFITFLAAAALAIVPELDNLTLESVKNGAVLGIVFVAFRSGIKAVIEAFIVWYSKK